MQNRLVHYERCPVCNSDRIHAVLQATDHTVSRETFEIWHCDECSFRFTQNAPGQDAIGRYYASQDYISHSETSEGLVNRLYHLVRQFTLVGKRKLIIRESRKTSGSLLDIGAGTGAFLASMQVAGWTVTGLEPDPTARANAEKIHRVTLLPAESINALPDAGFDVITLWHVLEHVHDLHGYFQQFGRLLKAGGLLVIAVPNYTSTDAKAYGAYWAAYDVPRHLYHFSPASMERLALRHSFSVYAKKPMWFDSFYVSLLSEKYKTGKSRLPAAFWNGLRSNARAAGSAANCSSVIYCLRKFS